MASKKRGAYAKAYRAASRFCTHTPNPSDYGQFSTRGLKGKRLKACRKALKRVNKLDDARIASGLGRAPRRSAKTGRFVRR